MFLESRLESAVLDAVLEDKPAQPLPCGSYLVSTQNVCCCSLAVIPLGGACTPMTVWSEDNPGGRVCKAAEGNWKSDISTAANGSAFGY